MTLSPSRADSFTGDSTGRSYKEIMLEEELRREEKLILQKIYEKGSDNLSLSTNEPKQPRRKRRWDEPNETPVRSEWDNDDHKNAVTSNNEIDNSHWSVTPQISSVIDSKPTRNRWDETPMISGIVDLTQASATKKR